MENYSNGPQNVLFNLFHKEKMKECPKAVYKTCINLIREKDKKNLLISPYIMNIIYYALHTDASILNKIFAN